MLEYGPLTAVLMLASVIGLAVGLKKGSVRGLMAGFVTSFVFAALWAATESLALGQLASAFFYLTGLTFFGLVGYGLGYIAKVDLQVQQLKK
ncbi:MAG: hypothetical protein ACP5MH_07290 [Thermoproteus sp.]